MIKKTEWFKYVTDEDLQVIESHYSMVMYSRKGRVFATQKACGNRSIFPLSTVYHPTDGNCVILTGNTDYDGYAEDFARINTVAQLNTCIDHANNRP